MKFSKPLLLLLLPLLWFVIPEGKLFTCDYSRAVFSSDDQLLRVWLTKDQQFRFAPSKEPLPKKYVTAVLTFEDRRFWIHPGIDPLSLVQSTLINMKSKQIKRGGSTITMQLARLSRPGKRNLQSKIAETCRALKISLWYTKKHELQLYAAHVPMGSNIIGIEAASFRYFGKSPKELTWAEASLLAVLPNAPGMIDISRKRQSLLEKRNRLLTSLKGRGKLSSTEYALAIDEPLPEKVSRIPFEAPHFCRFIMGNSRSESIHSTLDRTVQNGLEEELTRYRFTMHNMGVKNIAAIVVDPQTSSVLGYAGSQNYFDKAGLGEVDGIQARRSPGSVLKPILAAAFFDRGPFTPQSLIQDVPTYYGTFAPQNADRRFDGIVPLDQALIRSLNVPFVRLLDYYGTDQFYDLLKRNGVSFTYQSSYYGLTTILGGAETSLWELMQLYGALARNGEVRPLRYDRSAKDSIIDSICTAGSAGLTRTILTDVVRPEFEQYRATFTGKKGEIAWKTGTSYGQKDGWAIGFTGNLLIGVWVGNFSGEGNPAIGGAQSAAPLLFSLFNRFSLEHVALPATPTKEMDRVKICRESGFPSSESCPNSVIRHLPKGRLSEEPCRFHKVLSIDVSTGEQLCSSCWNNKSIRHDTLLIFPPAARLYRIQRGLSVDSIPPHSRSCSAVRSDRALELIYPTNGIRLFIPRNFGGIREKIYFSAAHRRADAELFWYLDNRYIGTTVGTAKLEVDSIGIGKHILFVQDADGSRATVSFQAFWRDK